MGFTDMQPGIEGTAIKPFSRRAYEENLVKMDKIICKEHLGGLLHWGADVHQLTLDAQAYYMAQVVNKRALRAVDPESLYFRKADNESGSDEVKRRRCAVPIQIP